MEMAQSVTYLDRIYLPPIVFGKKLFSFLYYTTIIQKTQLLFELFLSKQELRRPSEAMGGVFIYKNLKGVVFPTGQPSSWLFYATTRRFVNGR